MDFFVARGGTALVLVRMSKTSFLVKDFGANGRLVLEGAEGEPQPFTRKKVFAKNGLLGEILETIGAVENPLYVLAPAKGVDAEKLCGKKIRVELR